MLQATGLSSDLSQLSFGDSSPVGEAGSLLSGGQRSRIGLARALYPKDTQLYLLDDIFASLDAHVALELWDALFGGAEAERLTKPSGSMTRSPSFTGLQRSASRRATIHHTAISPLDVAPHDIADYADVESYVQAIPRRTPLINPNTSATVLVTHCIASLRRLNESMRRRSESDDRRLSRPWFTRVRVLRLNNGAIDYIGPLDTLPEVLSDSDGSQTEQVHFISTPDGGSLSRHSLLSFPKAGSSRSRSFSRKTYEHAKYDHSKYDHSKYGPDSIVQSTTFLIDIPMDVPSMSHLPDEKITTDKTNRTVQPPSTFLSNQSYSRSQTCDPSVLPPGPSRSRSIHCIRSTVEDTTTPEEWRSVGGVGRKVQRVYVGAVGIGVVLIVILALIFMQVCYSFSLLFFFPFVLFFLLLLFFQSVQLLIPFSFFAT